MELHICRALRGYTAPPAGRLHMPGHKGDGLRFPLCFSAPFAITELPFSDAREAPCGVIAAAQAEIAAILGAGFVCILTDGSSSGVYAMVRAAGAKTLLLPRDAHKSAYNACALLAFRPSSSKTKHMRAHGCLPLPQAWRGRCAGIKARRCS